MNKSNESKDDISKLIREWLDTAYKTALASSPNEEQTKAIEQMRHLHLDDYWYVLVPKIKALTKENSSE